MKEMKKQLKPLLFTTTIRNPERIPNLLLAISKYEKAILDNKIIVKILGNLINERLYKPTIISDNIELNMKYLTDELYNEDQLEYIIYNLKANHKEKDFDKGYPSRFDTMYKFIKELGLVYYKINEPIIISEAGHMLIDSFNQEVIDEQKQQNVYLNALMKYTRDNPFLRVSNTNNPLSLLFRVIKLFKDNDRNFKGIYKDELSLFICWKNNDDKELYDYIRDIRNNYGFSTSKEYYYERCLELLESDNEKRFKFKTIMHEYIDEYIRKFRLTGLITLRGNGRFIDYNSFELDRINYIIDNYSDIKDINDEKLYFDYLGSVDSNIVKYRDISEENIDTKNLKVDKLRYYASLLKEDIITKELLSLTKNNKSDNVILKYIASPLRLEFLISMLLVLKYQDIIIEPNYIIDDEGLPVSVARGNTPDIICRKIDQFDSTVEVTLLRDRAGQIFNEIIPIKRHLLELTSDNINNTKFSIFIAPSIHVDTIEAIRLTRLLDNVYITPYSIDEFINRTSEFSDYIKLSEVNDND